MEWSMTQYMEDVNNMVKRFKIAPCANCAFRKTVCFETDYAKNCKLWSERMKYLKAGQKPYIPTGFNKTVTYLSGE